MKKTILLLIMCLAVLTSAFSQLNTVNTGTAPNSGDGDNLRTAFGKVNANDQYLYSLHDEALTIVQILCTDTLAITPDETSYILAIGDALTGKNLVKMEAFYGDSQGDRVPTITAYRKRAAAENNMTSTGANFTTDATIDTSYDDVYVGDRIEIRWTLGSGTTAPYGIIVQLTFQNP